MSEINNRILTLFDYYYNKTNVEDYELKSINIKKISLEQLKIVDEEKSLSLLKELKSGKFKVNSFVNNVLTLVRYGETFPVTVKISEYKNDKEIKNFESKANRDNFISYLLSEKVLSGEISLLELPIVNFDVNFVDIKDMLTSYPELEYFENKISDNKISKKLSVRVRERFFKSKKLTEHLESDKCHLGDILFQVCLTLSQINNIYPKFRHNNLTLDNINIYFKKDDGKDKVYYVGSNSYNYVSPGYELKIGYFENACLEPILGGNKVCKDDLYYFVKELVENEYYKKIECDKLSLEIVDEILGDKKISSKINSMDNVSPISPSKVLKKLSKSKDTRKIKVSKSKSNSHDYYLGKNGKSKNSFSGIKVKGKLSREMGNVDFMDKKLKRNHKKSLKSKALKQKGGAPVMRPGGRPEPFNPGISNDERRSFKQMRGDKPGPREPAKLLEQTVYQPPGGGKPQKPNPNMYPPLHIAATHPSYRIPLPYQYDVNKLPIQNIYNISMADPRGDHSRLARIYEDITPSKGGFSLSSLTVGERVDSSNYIKSIMVNNKDGTDVSLTGGDGSLLEHVKLMEFNPYYHDEETPYEALPNKDVKHKNMLIYTSGYPIRYDEERGGIKLSKSSVGINMRIYNLDYDNLTAHTLGDKKNRAPWAELEYYQKINDILGKKTISPNFSMMHFWVFDRESRIKWKEIENIQNKNITGTQKIQQIADINRETNRLLIEKVSSVLEFKDKDKALFEQLNLLNWVRNELLNIRSKPEDEQTTAKTEIKNRLNRILSTDSDDDKLNRVLDILDRDMGTELTKDSGVSLGIITESATSTLIQWASARYNGMGSLKTMKQTGYHNYKEYESMLFQYAYGLAVLQLNKIKLNNFSVKRNLFVKDVYNDERGTKHWVYEVEGMKYYVPNYGYIGIIDSFYNCKINVSDPEALQLPVKFDASEREVFEDFKTLVNPNSYGKGNWEEKGGHKIPIEFANLLKRIDDKITELGSIKISDYLYLFKGLMNNKIGKSVTVSEMSSIDLTRFPSKLLPGTVVARRDASDSCYKWAVVVAKVETESIIHKYLVQTDTSVDPVEVSSSQLFVSCDNVVPDSADGVRYDLGAKLETYKLPLVATR